MKAFLAFFLLFTLLSGQVKACDLSSFLSTVCSNNICDIALLIEAANVICEIAGDTDYVINSAAAITINLSSSSLSTYNSLTLGANVLLNIQSALSTVGDFVVNAANTTASVISGVILTVQGDLSIAAQSTLSIAGNVTVSGTATINGVLYLAGNNVQSSAQTAWIVAQSSGVSVSGTTTAGAWIQGNGGIDGGLALSGNVTLAAGNSPGTVFVNGNMDMSSTTTLEVDVDSSSSFDRWIISGEFDRNGILYANFENGYIPSYGTNFAFASHSSSSGTFNIAHGDYDVTLDKVHPSYSSTSTSFEYNGANLVVPVVWVLGCIFALVF